MIRLAARLALTLIVGSTVLLLLISTRGYDRSTVTAFFAEGCDSMPCWQGIRPGETSSAQALALLRSHPWVDQISEVFASPKSNASGAVLIYWTWSDAYPFAEDARQQGIIVTDENLVRQIYLTTRIPLGDFWLAFGGADGSMINALNAQPSQPRQRIDNTALFAHAGLAVTATLDGDCSTELARFWNMPVYLWLRSNLPLPNRVPVGRQYQQLLASLCG